MAQVEDEILAAGAQIIWVLEQTRVFQGGTAQSCRDFMDSYNSTVGYCVGDSQTSPAPGTFDDSPFSIARGFDMIVRRSDMRIVYTTNHGTPGGNENPTGAEVLAAVQAAVAGN